MSTDPSSMESVSHENRKFPPLAAFSENAHIGSMEAYTELYQKSIKEPEAFWAEGGKGSALV